MKFLTFNTKFLIELNREISLNTQSPRQGQESIPHVSYRIKLSTSFDLKEQKSKFIYFTSPKSFFESIDLSPRRGELGNHLASAYGNSSR